MLPSNAADNPSYSLYAENHKNRLHYQNYDHLPLSNKHNHHQRIELVYDFPVFMECWLFQRDVDSFYLKWIENIVIQF